MTRAVWGSTPKWFSVFSSAPPESTAAFRTPTEVWCLPFTEHPQEVQETQWPLARLVLVLGSSPFLSNRGNCAIYFHPCNGQRLDNCNGTRFGARLYRGTRFWPGGLVQKHPFAAVLWVVSRQGAIMKRSLRDSGKVFVFSEGVSWNVWHDERWDGFC